MRIALALLVCSSVAAAAPAEGYGSAAPPRLRSPLEAKLEALVGEVAVAQHREPPRPDSRLGRAAEEIARRLEPDGRPPSELVQAALWLHGLVEPPPHLILVTLTDGGDAALFGELRVQLARPIAGARFRRVGAAVAPVAGEPRLSTVVVALQESFIELDPLPREVAGGAEVTLAGRLAAPYRKPEAFVTAPNGTVERVALSGDDTRFRGRFHTGPYGRYQVELAGEDRFGAAVLANFPIYAGVAGPATVPPARPPALDDQVSDAGSAELVLTRLVNADRAHAGLAPLDSDPRLAAVARAHSADMQAHGFLGHLSPTTGSAADRLRRAGVDSQVVLENVARAYSPGEAERGLMDSPGHRANLLGREVTRVGVGVVVASGMGGVRELFVTQVFTRPTETLDAGSRERLRRELDGLRRDRKLPLLGADPALDALAQSTARELASGALPASRSGAPLDRALPSLADRYASVRSVVAVSSSLDQIAGGLAKSVGDAAVTTCGIGIAAGKRADGSAALYAVIVLAQRR